MRGRMLGFQLAHSLVIDQPAWDRDLKKPDMDWLLDMFPGTILLVDRYESGFDSDALCW